MIVLLGTKPDFAVSEKWMLDRTGLSSSSYKSAKDALALRGWIKIEPYKSITVDIAAIYESGKPIAADGEEKIVVPIAAVGIATQEEVRKRAPIAADGKETIAARGKEPIAAGGNKPIAASPIINNTNTATNKIINKCDEKAQRGGGAIAQQEPKLISRTEAQWLEHMGNKLNWISENEFVLNGRLARVIDRLQ